MDVAPKKVPLPDYSKGTVQPVKPFSPESCAQTLRKALRGLGTNEDKIIDILGTHTNLQLQEVKKIYKTAFKERDLVEDLKSDLSGNFEHLCCVLLQDQAERDAESLKAAMKGLGTNETTLLMILCTRSNRQIQAIKAAYRNLEKKDGEEEKENSDLETDLKGETSGDFTKLLLTLCNAGRDEKTTCDEALAAKDAQDLYAAGEKRFGTDETMFNLILSRRNYPTLRCMLDEYKKIANHDFEEAIKSETNGDYHDGLQTIVKCIRNMPGFFAERIYKTMSGLGTNDKTLIHLIASRSEVDMIPIKEEFQKAYGKTLEESIKDDTSGDYQKLLIRLVTPN